MLSRPALRSPLAHPQTGEGLTEDTLIDPSTQLIQSCSGGQGCGGFTGLGGLQAWASGTEVHVPAALSALPETPPDSCVQ